MLMYIRNGRGGFLVLVGFFFCFKDKTSVILHGIIVNPLNRIFFQIKSFHEIVSKLLKNFLLGFALLLPFHFLLSP